MQQRHYARIARVGVWGSHALDKKVEVTISPEVFLPITLGAGIKLCLTPEFFGFQ